MTLKNSKINEIESLTWDILTDAYGQNKIEAPINLNIILEYLNLDLKQGYFSDKEIDGCYTKESKTIFISKNIPITRKKFTVAHEIGHFVLHEDCPNEVFRRKDMYLLEEEEKPCEQEANWFAASLLMPKKILLPLYAVVKEIDDLSKMFSVSNTAMNFRLLNLQVLSD